MECKVWQERLMTHCTMCNTYFELKWTIGWPYENFCSSDCRARWEKIKQTGYPAYTEKEMAFWTDLFRKKQQKGREIITEKLENKLAHWLKLKNSGSKVAHKVAQKTGSSLSYYGDEPLSHEPVLGNNSEPLFPVELLEEENDG